MASPPWSTDEDQKVREFALAGIRPVEIAKELGRSAAAVRHRFYKEFR
ncbi:SANT/Myb-like DNA-binding domain-containing protein [Bradyrhizobium sp. JYMT SZCCT0428]